MPTAASSLSHCCHPGAPTPQTPLHSSYIPNRPAYWCLWPLLCLEWLSLFSVANSYSSLRVLFRYHLLWEASLDLGLGWAPSFKAWVYQSSWQSVHPFWDPLSPQQVLITGTPGVSISNISPDTRNTEGSWDPPQLRAEWWLPEDERECFPQFYNRGLESSSGLVW